MNQTESTPKSATSKAGFTVIINNREFQTSEHVLTGSQIKALGGFPADYELYELRGNSNESVPVGNDQEVHIHERIQFRAIPAGTFGI